MELALDLLLEIIQPYNERRDPSPLTTEKRCSLQCLDDRLIELVPVHTESIQRERLEYAHHLLDVLENLRRFTNDQPKTIKYVLKHRRIAESLDKKALELSDLEWQTDRQFCLAYSRELIYISLLDL